MPVIIVKARQGVLATSQMKAQVIEEITAAFARVAGDESFKQKTTVIIEEIPDQNWGRAGKQVAP
jgi:4-oxalocrotonate tautomerase family enzyme